MKSITSFFVLLGLISLFVEPVNAQLFQRGSRGRFRSQRRCCCAPMRIVAAPVVHSRATTVATASPTIVLAPRPSIAVLPTDSSPSLDESLALPAAVAQSQQTPDTIVSPSDVVTSDEIKAWKSLFDGKTLGDWESTRFGGEGEVRVEDGEIRCDFGQYITGVTYKGTDLPKNNYEIELEAMRVDGGDFFCGLTFPVDESHATFVVGGWGGSVTGISSIDDYDASENDTTDFMPFKSKRWYKIRVRVTEGVLEAWIDDKKMVSKEVEGSRLSTRIEMDPSIPLGLACFDTQAAYRNIRIRAETNADTKKK